MTRRGVQIHVPRLHVLEEIDVILPCKSRVKKWAYENAWTLILMSALFAFTWLAMFLYALWAVYHGE